MLVAGTMLALGLTTIIGLQTAQTAFADEEESDRPNPMSELVTAIADKFGLSADDVQQVFDEHRPQDTERPQHQNFEDRLTQAVSDGTLTQEQADKIIAKQKELQESRDSFQDMSDEEREATMTAHMDELKQWAADNGIPEEFLPFGPGGGPGGPGSNGPHGPGGPNGDRTPPTDQDTETTTE